MESFTQVSPTSPDLAANPSRLTIINQSKDTMSIAQATKPKLLELKAPNICTNNEEKVQERPKLFLRFKNPYHVPQPSNQLCTVSASNGDSSNSITNTKAKTRTKSKIKTSSKTKVEKKSESPSREISLLNTKRSSYIMTSESNDNCNGELVADKTDAGDINGDDTDNEINPISHSSNRRKRRKSITFLLGTT